MLRGDHGHPDFTMWIRKGGKKPITHLAVSFNRDDEAHNEAEDFKMIPYDLGHSGLPPGVFFWVKQRAKGEKVTTGGKNPKALKRQIIGYRELVKEQPFNKDIKRKLLEAEGELILAQEHERQTQDKTIQDTVAFLGLKKEELARLMEQFREMDFDNSGAIDLSEFFAYIRVEQTEYNEKV